MAARWAVRAAVVIFAVAVGGHLCGAAEKMPAVTLVGQRSLFTTRQPLLQPRSRRRRLKESEMASKSHQTWVLGLPPSHQDSVLQTMLRASTDAKLLHALPGHGGQHGHHWIVSTDDAAVAHMLSSHPELTAARLPDTYKLCPELERCLQDSKCSGAGLDSEVATLVATLPHMATDELQRTATLAVEALTGSALHRACGVRVELGWHSLFVTTCTAGLLEVTSWLAAQPRVTWVHLQRRTRLHNLHAAAAIQAPSKVTKLHHPPKAATTGVSSGLFPLWAAGLDGTGQVVGVVDFGFDLDSCFFVDPTRPDVRKGGHIYNTSAHPFTPPNGINGAHVSTLPANVTIFQDGAHRKVVQFTMWAVDDDQGGHGSHTACTVAGSAAGMDPLTSPLLATGMAPGAKLALLVLGGFIDPGVIFDIQHKAGARIISNSWGTSGSTLYFSYFGAGGECYLYDLYATARLDTLIVFAAGNDGAALGLRRSGTTGSPATCKNAFSVGATENWTPDDVNENSFNLTGKGGKVLRLDTSAWLAPTAGVDPYIELQAADKSWAATLVDWDWHTSRVQFSPGDVAFVYMIRTPIEIDRLALHQQNKAEPDYEYAYNTTFAALLGAKRIQLVLSDPVDACSPLNTSAWPADVSVVVLARKTLKGGRCTGEASMRNARDSGAGGVMLFWNDAVGPVYSGSLDFDTVPFPAVSLAPEVGRKVMTVLRSAKVFIKLTDVPNRELDTPLENIADYSSFASLEQGPPAAGNVFDDEVGVPGVDARWKPDIVAPGALLSAAPRGQYAGKPDPTCEVVWSYGTSMATPVVSGAAAIVRQYFMEGWYPAGAPDPERSYKPSGVLLKAVLLAGAAAMTGISRITGQPLAAPPSPFQGYGRVDLSASLPLADDPRGWALQVVDGAKFKADGIEHTYNLTVQSSKQPLTVTLVWHDVPAFPGAQTALVNNLDLLVTGPEADIVWWGNGGSVPDYRNNVEKVTIATPSPGTYTIHVRAAYLFSGARPQRYSLVALGGFTGTLDSAYNPAVITPSPPPEAAVAGGGRR